MTMVNPLAEKEGSHRVHWNARSVRRKMHKIKVHIPSVFTDVITISESWLDMRDANSNYGIPGYSMFRQDRTGNLDVNAPEYKRAGGLLTYIKQGLTMDNDLCSNLNMRTKDIEILCTVIIKEKARPWVILNTYRPPSGNAKVFLDEIDNILDELNEKKYEIFIMGDMNLDVIDKANNAAKDLINLTLAYGMKQYIREPTRQGEGGDKATCIDLIFSTYDKIKDAGVLSVHLSDHDMVYLTTKRHKELMKKVMFRGRMTRNYDKKRYQELIKRADWSDIHDEIKVDDLWEKIIYIATSILKKMCPMRMYMVKPIKQPWVTPNLLEQMKNRDRAWARAKRTKNQELLREATKIKNKVSANCDKARKDHVKVTEEENLNDAKKFWREINELLPNNKVKEEIRLKREGDENYLSKEETPDFINKFFINIGPDLAKDMNLEWETKDDRCPAELAEMSTNIDEVSKLLRGINVSKPSGVENISARFLKDALEAIPEIVTELINKSFRTSTMPKAWKVGKITPLLKGGVKSSVNNLRPVSVLPAPSKLIEKIVHKRIVTHLEENAILTENQGGFRAQRSTVETIGDLTDFILRERNEGKITVAIFVDLCKAFDTVNHNILLKKMDLYGIRGKNLQWINGYLSDRKQCVVANNISSSVETVKCGVPQGSVIGPLMFLVYVNDMEKYCNNVEAKLFSDDTVLYKSGYNIEEITTVLQPELEKYHKWCVMNKLSINVNKTKVMVFSSNKKLGYRKGSFCGVYVLIITFIDCSFNWL